MKTYKGEPPPVPESEGALVVALRWPVRIVVLVLIVPVRIAWDALVVAGRAVRRTVWRPFADAALRLVRGLGVALVWLAKALFVWPWVASWRYVVVPAGRGLRWLGHHLVVVPAVAVYRYVLTPVGRVLAVLVREIAGAVVLCWHLAGRISRAVFGFLGRVLRALLVDPVVWVWRHVLRPVGRGVRDHLWRPVADASRALGRTVRVTAASARLAARQARADVRRALFGAPRPRPVEQRENR